MAEFGFLAPKKAESFRNTEDVHDARCCARINRNLWKRVLGRAAAVAVVLVVSAVAAHAQATPGEPQYWIGAAGGSASLGDDRCNAEIFLVRVASTCDDTSVGFKVFAGRALNDFLAVEVFGARLGEASFEAARYFGGFGLLELTLTGRHKFSVGATGLLRIPVKKLEVFLKGGPHRWSRETAYGDEVYDVNATGFDLAWGLGARYPIHRSLGVRVEVERLVIDEDDLNFVSAGLEWRF